MLPRVRSLASGLGLFVALAATGCVENGVGAPARGPDPAAVSATLALDLRNPQEARESIFGDVVLFPVADMGLALAVDGGSTRGTQDGFVDQVFLVQQKEPVAVEPRLLVSAELFYAGRLLMLRAPGSAPLTFTVRGHGDPDPVVDRLPFSAAGVERFTGYGISRRTGAWQVELNAVTGAAMADLLPSCAVPADGEVGVAQVCDSGGEGSTSCSTSCSGTRE